MYNRGWGLTRAVCIGGLSVALVLGVAYLLRGAESPSEPGAAVAASAWDSNESPAPLLSAFFGLDNDLPFAANRLCLGASGKDGMPVVLSAVADPETLQPEDFRVITASGSESTPLCVTLRPAQDVGELRTVLMIGEFGDAGEDPPVKVVVVDDLLSDADPPLNFRGAEVAVTPLDAGPAMVLAEVVPVEIWSVSGRGSACPADSQQVVRVTWAGGVKLPSGEEPGDAQRMLYRVTVTNTDGSSEEIAPTALGDLGDNDNNHLLCLDTSERVTAVAFPAGHLVDPNGDLNPDSQVAVTSGGEIPPDADRRETPLLNHTPTGGS